MLKYFARSITGAAETIQTQVYTIDPPVTSISLEGETYKSARTITLFCEDAGGMECSRIYYTVDGSTPTTASAVYSGPIEISATTTLKYFAQDADGGCEEVQTQTFIIDSGLATDAIRIAGWPSTHYGSLQAAYNAATDFDVIQVKAINLIESLVINRNISVTIEGGHSDDFSSVTGDMTMLKGSIQTVTGGGTLAIRNFNLIQ